MRLEYAGPELLPPVWQRVVAWTMVWLAATALAVATVLTLIAIR